MPQTPLRLLRVAAGFLAATWPATAAPVPVTPPPSSLDRTLAVLDAALPVAESAAPSPDGARIYLGDQGYRPDALRAWRDRLAAARAELARAAATPSGASSTAAATPNENATRPGGDDLILESAFASVAAPQLWPGGVVPYVFDAAITPAQRQAFLDAAGEVTAFAHVTFVPRAAQADYVRILPYAFAGGRADVGRIGGEQRIEISSWNRGTLVHEIGHCVGLIHEHQRADRDSYVTILWANVLPGSEGNFILLPSAVTQGAYDFESVMHYSRTAFSIDPAAPLYTIQPLPAYAAFGPILDEGFADRVLSARDRTGLAAIYGTPAIAPGAVVKNTRDSGPGSLRAAIYYAWDHPGTTITFQIPVADPGFAGGVFTITPTDVMTRLGPATTLDATTQTAFTGNTNAAGPEVVLAGTAAVPPFIDGLRLRSANCTVRGLVIRDFTDTGIRLFTTAATGNKIEGCYIGTDATGATAAPNVFGGVLLERGASANTIGGTTLVARNLISGNGTTGITLRDPGTADNVVAGNFIGLDRNGAFALPNLHSGIGLFSGASANRIGGIVAGAGNVISGNAAQGIAVVGAGTATNRIEGNAVGTNAARTVAVPNAWSGISLWGGASANTIGGTTVAAMNLISGNGQQGVTLSEDGTDANVVAGNRIGTNVAGTAALPNTWTGISLWGGASGNTIGGTTAGAGNLISGNLNQGLTLSGAGTSQNLVAGNRIGTNAAGTAAVPNAWSGIQLWGDADDNVIGGLTSAGRNLVSGNGNYGIALTAVAGTRLEGNFIGTDAPGTSALANAWSGIAVFADTTGTRIGGTTPGAGNVISGNGDTGIQLAGLTSTATTILGNLIGLSATGTAVVSNAWSGLALFDQTSGNIIGGATGGARNWIAGHPGYGVELSGGATANQILGNAIGLRPDGAPAGNTRSGLGLWGGAHHNVIGGGSGAGNLITANGWDGITLWDAATAANSILANQIFANAAAGIQLYNSANADRLPPTLTTATLGLATAITGTFAAPTAGTYRLEFFTLPAADAEPSGAGEARHFVGGTSVAVAAGTPTFNVNLAALVPSGLALTATLTDPAGNTSAFAVNRTVTTTDSDNDGLPNAYETAHGLNPVFATDAASDTDGDGFTALQEFYAGTHPQQSTSFPPPLVLTFAASDVVVILPTALAGKIYQLETRDELGTPPWRVIATGLTRATPGPLQWTDPGAATQPRRFYRAVLQP